MQNCFGKFKINLCTFYPTHRQKIGSVYNRCTICGLNKPNQMKYETKRFPLSKRTQDELRCFLEGSRTEIIFIYFEYFYFLKSILLGQIRDSLNLSKIICLYGKIFDIVIAQ